jgi:hypothetical protein
MAFSRIAAVNSGADVLGGLRKLKAKAHPSSIMKNDPVLLHGEIVLISGGRTTGCCSHRRNPLRFNEFQPLCRRKSAMAAMYEVGFIPRIIRTDRDARGPPPYFDHDRSYGQDDEGGFVRRPD